MILTIKAVSLYISFICVSQDLILEMLYSDITPKPLSLRCQACLPCRSFSSPRRAAPNAGWPSGLGSFFQPAPDGNELRLYPQCLPHLT